ncbi:MAG TPA: alpha/beta hydrolase [Alphaproteobacteria bacterium]|nr:alpha/beta hydrolase [Alphaproteobacteria bacterium]
MASIAIERRTKRWQEQRWVLDSIIKAIGPEWDQGRIASKSKPGGETAEKDFRAAARRMKRFDDMHREFANAARKRQARAKAYEEQGRFVTAGESYIAAALLWASACWPIFEANETLHAYEEQMNHCYAKFIKYAPHPIEKVEVPYGKKSLPAYLHLPRKPAAGEKFPCVISIGGMDGSKENMVSIYGDRFLARGLAVLAIDGPGQAESASRGIFFTPTAFADAGIAIHKFLSTKKSIDINKLAIRSSSFGSYFGTVASAALGDKIKGYAVSGVCQEPGCHTIFETASPTFKARFMFMSGYDDEAAFDKMRQKIDLRPVAPKIKAPYMVVAGENDQLSPIEYTEELFHLINAPKRLVIYEGANHSVGDAPSVEAGDEKNALIADWLLDRVNGKPFQSERVWYTSSGKAEITPYGKAGGGKPKAKRKA